MLLTEQELMQAKQQVETYKVILNASNKAVSKYLDEVLDECTPDIKHWPMDAELSLGNYTEEGWANMCKTGNYTVNLGDVRFITKETENEEVKRTDFGSSFSLEISANHIYVNSGTIGTFTSTNIYQVTRLKVMSALFDREQEIVEHVKTLVNLEARQKYTEAINSINMHNSQIAKMRREEEAKRNEELLKSSVGKVIVTFRTGEYLYDENNNCIGKTLLNNNLCYYIDKITPKRVYIKMWDNDKKQIQEYRFGSDQLKKDFVICQLKERYYRIVDKDNVDTEVDYKVFEDGTEEKL